MTDSDELDAARWRELRQIFSSLAELPAGEREARLGELPADVAARARSLLAAAAAAPDTTALLVDWGNGDRAALDRLVPLVHAELRQVAHRQMRRERAGGSLQTTALVHEAYLRLVDYRRVRPRDRSHFLAIAAQAMRRVLVERARACHAAKRGGGGRAVTLEEVADPAATRAAELVALDDALLRLSALDPRKAQVVELKYFGGLTTEEVAEALAVSVATVERDWSVARLWLRRELGGGAA